MNTKLKSIFFSLRASDDITGETLFIVGGYSIEALQHLTADRLRARPPRKETPSGIIEIPCPGLPQGASLDRRHRAGTWSSRPVGSSWMIWSATIRDSRFTGNAGLAEPAAVAFESKTGFRVAGHHVKEKVPAFELVMAGLAESADGAAVDAFFAYAFGMEEAVSAVVFVGPRGGGYGDIGDYRAAAHCLSFRGDEPIAETEGA